MRNMNTFDIMLSLSYFHVFSALFPYIDKVGPSISNLTVFVGMNGTSEELGLPAGNMWYFNGYGQLYIIM